MENSNIVVLYHKNCPDGFSSAWVAWTVFGEQADYIPVVHEIPAPEGIEDKDVYFLDFVYPKDVMNEFIKNNNKVIAIDHHETEKETTKSIPEHVFNNDHSAAVLTWKYFYPNKSVPKLLRFIEDIDLWNFNMDYTEEVISFLALEENEFENWSRLVEEFEDPETFQKNVEKGKIILKHKQYLTNRIAEKAQKVSFEGYEVMAVNTPVLVTDVGHKLYTDHPPFSIMWYRGYGSLKVSMRSNGDVDVGSIAKKYKGGGHKESASFKLPQDSDLPWKAIERNKVNK